MVDAHDLGHPQVCELLDELEPPPPTPIRRHLLLRILCPQRRQPRLTSAFRGRGLVLARLRGLPVEMSSDPRGHRARRFRRRAPDLPGRLWRPAEPPTAPARVERWGRGARGRPVVVRSRSDPVRPVVVPESTRARARRRARMPCMTVAWSGGSWRPGRLFVGRAELAARSVRPPSSRPCAAASSGCVLVVVVAAVLGEALVVGAAHLQLDAHYAAVFRVATWAPPGGAVVRGDHVRAHEIWTMAAPRQSAGCLPAARPAVRAGRRVCRGRPPLRIVDGGGISGMIRGVHRRRYRVRGR